MQAMNVATVVSEPIGRQIDAIAAIAAREHAHEEARVDRLLRCVSSGYLAGGCSCGATIPASVVTAAWAHEIERSGAREGFFRFDWRGGVWLAFGLLDGHVRGVYCPEHSAERAGRSSAPPVGSAA